MEARESLAVERIAKAFLKQRYALSPEGDVLREQVRLALERKDAETLDLLKSRLPTVEQPHLELFADIALDALEQREVFTDLANIQVTKGCSHKCTFCAAGSADKVETMPYPAILKIAKLKKAFDDERERRYQELLPKIERIRTAVEKAADEDLARIEQAAAAGKIPGYRVLGARDERKSAPARLWPSVAQRVMRDDPDYQEMFALGVIDRFVKEGSKAPRVHVTNYYDSDPFNYRDASFVHEDGQPADYGDVVRALATPERPVHITTAGWKRGDKISQAAAEKIAELYRANPGALSNPRISINPSELTARKSHAIYLEDMMDVIRRMESIGPELLLFRQDAEGNVDAEFEKNVIDPIVKEFPQLKHARPIVSRYSGPNASPEAVEDHHDVMACMPGSHINPDGSISVQDRDDKESRLAKKGARPRPTGKVAFTLK